MVTKFFVLAKNEIVLLLKWAAYERDFRWVEKIFAVNMGNSPMG